IFAASGIDEEKIHGELMKCVKKGIEPVAKKKLSQTPRTKLALKNATKWAKAYHSDTIKSEHVLLGLLQVQDSVAAQVLMNLGLTLEKARAAIANQSSQEIPEKGTSSAIPAEYIGHWKGQAKIIVNWTKQKNLPIDIEIHSDGTVEGKVGDAELVNGRLVKKSWVYTKVFQHENPYRIEGDLQGEIIKSENIQRDSVLISLRVEDGKIDGGLSTSGTKTGNKKNMKLSAMDVSLIKVDEDNAFTIRRSSI
ncbi:MAG: Clp protease N-terminal domain-containing protein, partial [Planctomycetota bacterium]